MAKKLSAQDITWLRDFEAVGHERGSEDDSTTLTIRLPIRLREGMEVARGLSALSPWLRKLIAREILKVAATLEKAAKQKTRKSR